MSVSQPPGAAGIPDPWPHPSEILDLSARPVDVLTSPGEEAALEGRPRRPRLPVLIAAATVVALVLGGVAYAGMRLWYGSGAQPEAAAPSTVVAFARLDLAPGLGQQRGVGNLAQKFPQLSGKDAVAELKEGILRALEIDEASYRDHVEPWFADRVGVAWWMGGEKRPYGLVMLAARDESMARTSLTELQRKLGADEFGFVVGNGYVLVAAGEQESQAAAEQAAGEAERESLADSPEFRQGVEWLPGQQTALAWADLSRMGQATRDMTQAMMREMPGATGEGSVREMAPLGVNPMGALMFGLPGLGGLPGMADPTLSDDLKGRVIVGAQATDDGVEIRFRGFGTDRGTPVAPIDARSTVDSLPANSALAGAFRVSDAVKEYVGRGPEPEEMLPEEMWEDPDLPPGVAEKMRKQMREDMERLEAMNKAFAALSGSKVSIAATGLDDEIPALIAAAETASAGDAATLAEALKLFGDSVTVSASGNKVELTTDAYAAEGGTLAGQALYREALDGAPREATAVLYVDVQRLLADQQMTDEQRRQAEPVKAVGLGMGTEDGDQIGLLRIVIR